MNTTPTTPSRLAAALAPLLLVVTGTSLAQNTTLRCPQGLVELGDTKYDVRQACGEPAYSDYDLWIYDFGPGRFNRLLRFADDRLVTIEQDDNR